MAVDTRLYSLVESERLLELAAAGGYMTSSEQAPVISYSPGELIAGKYRLVRLLGRGGMGVVWEAYSNALDINVAIKLIHHETNNEEKKRLMIEARAAARLADPAIVRVFDCGETLSGVPYVVMELLLGEELAERLDNRGRLAPIDAVSCLLPVVRALAAAHMAGIVHRDVKPENVFFAPSATGIEQPKLLDFGIAQMDARWEKRLTQAGSALGSPNYMSPEQARGEDVDRRTDIWSICVVMYEAITGELPFDGNGYNAVMHSILTAPLRSFSELGVQEPELWQIVSRGLERSRSARWQDCEQLANALGEWLIARGVTHDVTGMSLQVARAHQSPVRFETLQSFRPPQISAISPESTPGSMAAITTPGRPRLRRAWPKQRAMSCGILAAIAVLAVAVVFWRVLRVKEASAPPTSAAVAFSPAMAPPVAGRLTTAPVGSAVPTVEPKSVDVSASSATKPVPKVSARRARPVQQNDEFKSPFD